MTEQDALTAYRQAIAETNQVRAAFATHGHQETALAHAEHWELRKGRAYLAARDASVAGQGDTTITAYRAAAAKLGEALAIDDTRPYAAFERGDVLMEWYVMLPEGPARTAMRLMSMDTWTLGAARLRLLAEAMLLEQEARQEPAEFAGDARIVRTRDDAELGALVREWRGGAQRGQRLAGEEPRLVIPRHVGLDLPTVPKEGRWAMNVGDGIRVVLDCEEAPDGGYRVRLRGVFPDDDEPLPDKSSGAQRNVVRAFYGVPTRVGAFHITDLEGA